MYKWGKGNHEFLKKEVKVNKLPLHEIKERKLQIKWWEKEL